MFYRASGIDVACTKCSLSKPPCIHGTSEVPLNKAALVVIAAYPSTEEVRQGYPLAPSDKVLNAGAYVRKAISAVFDGDESIPLDMKPFTMHTFFTNVIRCPTQDKKEKKEVKPIHLSTCKSWLDLELSQLSPNVPILIASSEAVKALLGADRSLYASRGRVWNVDGHPAIVTMNPIEPTRYVTYEVDKTYRRRDGTLMPKTTRMSKPVMGSVPWFFKRDLVSVKELVLKYISEKNN